MKHEVLMEMSKSQLDDYAQVLGLDVSAKKTVSAKVSAIEEKRARVAEIDALGMTFSIPVKRMHDQRVADLTSKAGMSDAAANELLEILLGEEQIVKLTERATDEDGTVDVEALGIAMAQILTSDDLKNF